MINLRNLVPTVYTDASRDFQYLNWLINIVLNSVKHNVDDMYQLPNTKADSKLTELLALTLGFKVKRNYNQEQLAALVAILPNILKYKGTIRAVSMAVDALIATAGAFGDPSYEVVDNKVIIVLPKELIDTTLLIDLLDYILPAGMTYRIIKDTQTIRRLDNIYTAIDDEMHCEVVEDLAWENTLSTGLSSLFDGKLSDFSANFISDKLNTGLLSNTVIPVLSGKVLVEDSTVKLYSTEANGSNKLLYADPANEVLLKAKSRNDITQEL